MQTESMPYDFKNQPIKIPKMKLDIKKILIYVVVAVVAAGLSGLGVWMYMSVQNDSNKKELNAKITTNTAKITSLQANVKSLNSQIATKTTTATTTTAQQPTATTGIYESMITLCDSDGTTASPVKTDMTTLWGDVTGKYFGECSVGPTKSPVGGYIIWTKYVSGQWKKMFAGQDNPPNIDALCTQYSIPNIVNTACKNNW